MATAGNARTVPVEIEFREPDPDEVELVTLLADNVEEPAVCRPR